MVDLRRWIFRREQAPPPESMDWCPTTPPPTPPVYPEGYIIGGFPPTPPRQTNNAFARPASPHWIVSGSKRICLGLQKTGQFAWAATRGTGIGAGRIAGASLQFAGKQTWRGTAVAANFAQTSTTSIIRNWQRSHPRHATSPRTKRANVMKAREEAAQEKRRQVSKDSVRKLAHVYEPCPTNEMIWAPHFEENGSFNPNETFLGYRAPKETAIFPADNPSLQLERELVAAIPLSHRFMQTPRRPRVKGRVGILNNKRSGLAMPDDKDRKACGPGIFNINNYAEENEKRSHAAFIQEHKTDVPDKEANETPETPETPAEPITVENPNISEQSAAGIQSWINEIGNSPPSPRLTAAAIELDPELTPFEKRRKKLAIRRFVKVKRSNSNSSHKSDVNMGSSLSRGARRAASPKAQGAASVRVASRSPYDAVELIPAPPTPSPLPGNSSPATQNSPEFAQMPIDQQTPLAASRAAQQKESPDVIPKIEEPLAIRSVPSPSADNSPVRHERIASNAPLSDLPPTGDISPMVSDISSTCDISPLPDYHPVQPVADAVGSPSNPAPSKVASKAPSPRMLVSAGAYSPPGAWIEDEGATMGQDVQATNHEAIDKAFMKTPARRNVSMPIRGHGDKQEAEIRTPERAETDSPKANTHGTLRKTLKDKIAERRAEAEAQRSQYTITPLSKEWDDKVEGLLETGIQSTGVKAGGLTASDLSRCAPPRIQRNGHDNWLNDEVINKYLKMVADFGVQLSGRSIEKTTSHFAFNSFFYSKLADSKQGIKSISRWVSRARINGQRLLDVEMLFIPINSGLHWTLAVVSGTNKTITYYDSLGGNGKTHLRILLDWVQSEIGSAFAPNEWQLIEGRSGMQNNSDDCGVFTITNARQLTLGMVPHETFGPQQAQIQRRRIVAELANGALLVAGS